MSSCRDHPPLTLPHDDGVTVTDAGELARRPQAKVPLLALRSDDRRGILIRCAIARHEGDELFANPLLALMPHQPAVEPFGKRQAHCAFRFLHQISGKAEVVDMCVRQGEILQWTAAQQPSPQPVPDLEDFVGIHAAVDQRPAGTVVEQPAIDVIERQRNGQSHPEQSGQNVRQFAIGRRALNGEFQIVWHCCLSDGWFKQGAVRLPRRNIKPKSGTRTPSRMPPSIPLRLRFLASCASRTAGACAVKCRTTRLCCRRSVTKSLRKLWW